MVILLKMVNPIEESTTSVPLPYLSEFRLIRPQDGISVLPLPITRSKELLLYVFRKYIRQPMSRYSGRISPPLNSPQVCPGLPYGLLKDTHYSVNSIQSL